MVICFPIELLRIKSWLQVCVSCTLTQTWNTGSSDQRSNSTFSVSLCETWLDSSFNDGELSLPQFSFLRGERVASKHGGALIAIHNSLEFQSLNLHLLENCCCLAASIKCARLFVFLSAYNPPASNKNCWPSELYHQVLKQLRNEYPGISLVLSGNLNLPNAN